MSAPQAGEERAAPGRALARGLEGMLREAGLPAHARLSRVAGGANNRVYRVEAGSARVLLKVYFRSGADARDRLGAELAFARFARARGIACVPRPLACDRALGLALFEWVEGAPFRAGGVGAAELRAAEDFLRALCAGRDVPEAHALPPASEACFSLAGHLRGAAGRLERLAALERGDALAGEAAELVARRLRPALERLAEELPREAAELGCGPEDPLPQAGRCLSPSDFGFHNALRTARGEVVFLDFEYAGWDDPAKLVGDFFSQPAVPVPPRFFERFSSALARLLPDPDWQLRRMRALLPLFRLRWCCILLNEFLPGARERRAFARPAAAAWEARRAQLERARRLAAELRPGAILARDPA
jgi:hypothetical protein